MPLETQGTVELSMILYPRPLPTTFSLMQGPQPPPAPGFAILFLLGFGFFLLYFFYSMYGNSESPLLTQHS